MFSSNVLVLLWKTKSVKRLFKYDGVQVAHYLNQDIVCFGWMIVAFESAALTRQVKTHASLKLYNMRVLFCSDVEMRLEEEN